MGGKEGGNQKVVPLPGRLSVILHYQVAEKWPSAAFPSSFVVAAYSQVRLTTQNFGGLASAPF